MTPSRLAECLQIVHWSPATLTQVMSLPEDTVESWLQGERSIPTNVASWIEALCFTHESADLLMPKVDPGAAGEGFDSVQRLEHIPSYSYHLLRRLSEGPVGLRSLFGTDDEAAVFFLVSRGLAERREGDLTITPSGKRIGEIQELPS